MCNLVPHEVKSISGVKVTMTDGLKAFYDKKIGTLKIGDEVLVYGNLIISKNIPHEKIKQS